MARRTSSTTTTTTGAGTATTPRPRSNGPAAIAAPVRTTPGATAARREPTADEIRRRAYEIYLTRRGVGGSPESDWLQAERELRGR